MEKTVLEKTASKRKALVKTALDKTASEKKALQQVDAGFRKKDLKEKGFSKASCRQEDITRAFQKRGI